MFDFSKLGMQPRYSKYSQPATEEQIAELEKYCGHTLPENYKQILRNYNGAVLGASYFDSIDEESGIALQRELAIFYYLDDDRKGSENIWYAIRKFSPFIGQGAIPFADDGNRQIYYLKWENNIPQVWFFSYLDVDEPETFMVCDSFDKMLGDLYAED